MRISQIKTARRNIEEGAWVSHIPNLPGIKLKVRGLYNTEAMKIFADARLSMTEEEWNKPEVQEELDVRVLAEAVIVDWDGILDDTDEPSEKGEYPPLEYDPEVAKMLLADPEMTLLRQGARYAATNVAELGQQNLEKAAKN